MRYRTVFGEEVYLSEAKWEHILNKHPEVKSHFRKIEDVFMHPDIVKLSKRDAGIHLYYKFYRGIFDGKYLLVVINSVKKSIVTIFITDKIKVGEIIWPGK